MVPYGLNVNNTWDKQFEMIIGDALNWAIKILQQAEIDNGRLDAQLLLCHILRCRREDIIRDNNTLLPADKYSAYQLLIERRAKRIPLPYLTGAQAFYGRNFIVNENVLIPRPETEILIETALKSIQNIEQPYIADIGTGSGCIGITMALERPDAHVWLTDISHAALEVAIQNAKELCDTARLHFAQGSLLEPLPQDVLFDLILSNPPYVSTNDFADLQPEVRDYEPKLALTGADGITGEDGLTLYPILFTDAYSLLKDNGSVIVEIGYNQSEVIMEIARQSGYAHISAFQDLSGIVRVIRAIKN